jgi:exonuclease VII small subunit
MTESTLAIAETDIGKALHEAMVELNEAAAQLESVTERIDAIQLRLDRVLKAHRRARGG